MIKNYLSLIKISHTVFALPFGFVGFFTAIYFSPPLTDYPYGMILLKVCFCMIFARSSAMAFNRYADRKYDKLNPRTSKREIPSEIISLSGAMIFIILSSVLFIFTAYTLNPLCFYLSPVALLTILGYSYTKRFTWLCHIFLGLGLSFSPIGAYIAVTGYFDQFSIVACLFSFCVLFWVSGFDIIYSLQDKDFDNKTGLKSIPVITGIRMALIISSVFHFLSGLFLIVAGIFAAFGIYYWIGTIIFLGLLFYQHTLVKTNDLSKVNLAFFTTNGIASVIFAVFLILDVLL